MCLKTTDLPRVTLFFDGKCPLCQAEIVFLSRRNRAGLLGFVDIHSDLYDERAMGLSCSQALAEMYGQFDNGLVIAFLNSSVRWPFGWWVARVVDRFHTWQNP